MANLLRHHQIFKAVLFSGKFRGDHIEKIKDEVITITSFIHGFDYDFAPIAEKLAIINDTKELIVNELFYHYLEQRHYENFNHHYSLSTWIVTYIYWNIRNLRRRYRPRCSDDYIGRNTDIYDERNKNFRLPYDEYQEWVDMTESADDPEAILSAKQLLQMMLGFFGEIDTQVLLGMIPRSEAVLRCGLNRKQYERRLNGQRELFIKALNDIDYLPL